MNFSFGAQSFMSINKPLSNSLDLLIGISNYPKGISSYVLSVFGITSKRLEPYSTKFVGFDFNLEDVFISANRITRNIGNSYVGPECLLLGILEHENTNACVALKDLGVPLVDLKNEIYSMCA